MSIDSRQENVAIPEVSFDSPLTNLVIDLDVLRFKPITGSTPDYIFEQLKRLFHLLESVESARIEGNRTTIAAVIDHKQEHGDEPSEDEQLAEILNIENALKFIEENVHTNPIDRKFISHLHSMVVDGLTREGSKTPGAFRNENVKISGSTHIPPEGVKVSQFADDLFSFINTKDESKYDLIKIAVAHHRFAWVHPFDNGNGRMARLLTYAMLIKFGFPLDERGRIINPTGLFCADRDKYYDMLSDADRNGEEGLERWCVYVLGGIKEEVGKVTKLAQYEFLRGQILLPALGDALKFNAVSEIQFKVLNRCISKGQLVAADVRKDFPDYYPEKTSRLLRKLAEEKIIRRYPKKDSRTFIPYFLDNGLMRFVIQHLYKQGYLGDDDPQIVAPIS